MASGYIFRLCGVRREQIRIQAVTDASLYALTRASANCGLNRVMKNCHDIESGSPAAAGRDAGGRAVGVFRPCGRGADRAPGGRGAEELGRPRRWPRATPRWPAVGASASRRRARYAAQLVGAHADEIALVPNTTAGISLVAEGLDWRPGDNVVTLADEFPSNVYPWLNLASRGVETRRVPTDDGRLDLDELAAACDERTRIVSVSWVGFATGYRHDVERIVEIWRTSAAPGDARRDPRSGRVSARRARNAGRLPGGRRAQVDARARGGRPRLHPPRALDTVAAAGRRLAQRRPRTRLHAHRAEAEADRPPGTRAARRTWPACSAWARASTAAGSGHGARGGRDPGHHRPGLRAAGGRSGPRSSPTVGPNTAAAGSGPASSPSNCPAATRWP